MTQMATETIIEIETVVDDLTDHEFDICCDLTTDWADCTRPARWVSIKTCCGNPSLMCDDCKNERMATEDGTVCSACDAFHIPARTAYLYIEPLRRN